MLKDMSFKQQTSEQGIYSTECVVHINHSRVCNIVIVVGFQIDMEYY